MFSGIGSMKSLVCRQIRKLFESNLEKIEEQPPNKAIFDCLYREKCVIHPRKG